MEGLGSIKRSGAKSGMSKLKGLNVIAKGKGKDELKAQRAKGLKMKGTKGLPKVSLMKPSKVKGLPRVTKGGWSEYVESFNKPSGSERQVSHYSKTDNWA